MLDALEGYLNRGGRLMYLGGNGFYWVTSFDAERPHIIECRRSESGVRTWQAEPGEYYHSTTGELGGLWRFRHKIPQRLVGIGMTATGGEPARPYRRLPASEDPRERRGCSRAFRTASSAISPHIGAGRLGAGSCGRDARHAAACPRGRDLVRSFRCLPAFGRGCVEDRSEPRRHQMSRRAR